MCGFCLRRRKSEVDSLHRRAQNSYKSTYFYNPAPGWLMPSWLLTTQQVGRGEPPSPEAGTPFSPSSQSASRSPVGLSPGSVLVGSSGSRDGTHQPKSHHANPLRHVQTARSTVVLAAFWGLRPLCRQRQQGAGSQLSAQPKWLWDAPCHEVPHIPPHLCAGAVLGTPRHPRTPSPMAGTRRSRASPS